MIPPRPELKHSKNLRVSYPLRVQLRFMMSRTRDALKTNASPSQMELRGIP